MIVRLTLTAAALACLTSACMPTGRSSSTAIAWQVRGAELVGDVDGDGHPEEVAVEDAGERSCLLRLRARGARYTTTTPIRLDWCADKPPQHHPSVIGLAAIDRRPGLEILVELGCGAHTCFATVFGVNGRALDEWRVPGGRLSYGGSAGTGSRAADCARPKGVVVLSTLVHRTSTLHRTWYRARSGRLERIRGVKSDVARGAGLASRLFASCTDVSADD